MNTEKLIIYEAPWYTELISWEWLQDIIAKRLANKVNKKFQRYLWREARTELMERYNKIK